MQLTSTKNLVVLFNWTKHIISLLSTYLHGKREGERVLVVLTLRLSFYWICRPMEIGITNVL